MEYQGKFEITAFVMNDLKYNEKKLLRYLLERENREASSLLLIADNIRDS